MSNKLFFAALLVWICVVGAELFIFSQTFTSCPTNLDSIYGEAGCSFIPLGYTCTWENFPEGAVAKSYPSLSTLLAPLVLLLWGYSLLKNRKSSQ